jgi:hypothetical protein
MPVDFSNAQSIMFWGAAVDDTTSSIEQPAKTPEQIAEAQHQELIGVGLFVVMALVLCLAVYFGDRRHSN